MTDEEKALKEITKNWTNAPDKRICAICLEEVNRSEYHEHTTKVHGYTVINITASSLVR